MIVTRSNTTLVVDSRAIIKYAEYISLHNEAYNYYTVSGVVTDKNKEEKEKENLKLEVKQKMAICFMKKKQEHNFCVTPEGADVFAEKINESETNSIDKVKEVLRIMERQVNTFGKTEIPPFTVMTKCMFC